MWGQSNNEGGECWGCDNNVMVKVSECYDSMGREVWLYWCCDGCDGEGEERGYITTPPVYRHPSTGTDLQCKDFPNILAKHYSISADEDNLLRF